MTNILGLSALSPAEQVKSLLALPPSELVTKLAGVPVPLAAVVDGDIVKAVPTYTALADTAKLDTALFPGAKWCKTIVISDNEWDGMIIPLAGRPDNVNASLKKCLETVFADAPATAAAVVKAYGLDPAPEGTIPVVKYISDISFALGAKATAQAWAAAGDRLGTKAYLGHFNWPNPWDGPWKGHATHALDMAIALGNYNQFLGAGQKATAEGLAADLIAFANGKEPFPVYSGKADAKSKVWYAGVDSTKDESAVVTDSDENATKRRSVLEKLAGGNPAVLDKFSMAFGMLLQGPPK